MNFNIEELKNINIKTFFSKDNKYFPYIILAVIVALFVYFFIFLRPLFSSLASTMPEIARLQTDLKKAKDDISKFELFKKELNELSDKINLYEKRLPSEREIPNILESLSEIAKSTNVKIDEIKLVPKDAFEKSTGKKNSVYTAIPIEISAKCGYHELGSFINLLENSERFMVVDDVLIESNKLNLRQHNIKLSISTFVVTKEESEKK